MTLVKKEKQVPFSRLSKADKRRTIARDALTQLKIGITQAQQGEFIDLENQELPEDKIQLNKILSDIRGCQVCGLGSLALAHIDRFNKCEVSASNYTDGGTLQCRINLQNRLNGIFSYEQLNSIETAFEKDVMISVSDELDYGSLAFGCKYENNTDRLVAILKNIIKNGEFKLPKWAIKEGEVMKERDEDDGSENFGGY